MQNPERIHEKTQVFRKDKKCLVTFHFSSKPLNQSWSSTSRIGSIIALLMANFSQESPILTTSAANTDEGPTLPLVRETDRSEKMLSRLELNFMLSFTLFPWDFMKS